MDRKVIYPGQIPLETDLLDTNRFAMVGLSKLTETILGAATVLSGLNCTPTHPNSLQIQIEAGAIYSLQLTDATPYSSLPADVTRQLVKQGLLLDTLILSCLPPTTNGHSINYLVQFTYEDIDSEPITLPYYNAANPQQAFSGPNNNGAAQPTVRRGACIVTLKVGISAPDGSQTTPTPDPGFVGGYVVTVAAGATAITADNIKKFTEAPFLNETLPQKISRVTADELYATKAMMQIIDAGLSKKIDKVDADDLYASKERLHITEMTPTITRFSNGYKLIRGCSDFSIPPGRDFRYSGILPFTESFTSLARFECSVSALDLGSGYRLSPARLSNTGFQMSVWGDSYVVSGTMNWRAYGI